jgi:protein-disulfide isomerase-like protein with CxxC motif
VVQDNDFAIWNRWGVRAWPTLALVDKRGTIRYRHIGEGAYAETEGMITQLLAEGG